MTPSGIEQLKEDEGFRGEPYKCTANKTTIGYGRNLEDNPLTKSEAEYLLLNDLKEIEYSLNGRPFFDKLNDTRKDVLINMAYNLGIPRLLNFINMIAAISNDDYEKAADEMLDSKWARQVGNRATRLSKKMRTGNE